MEINVSVENVDFKSVIGYRYDDEDERVDATLGGRVAELIVKQLVKDTGWRSFAQHVQDVRDEEIRKVVAEEIHTALTTPYQKTNPFGEATGETTTIREAIAKEARDALVQAGKYGDRYSSIPAHAEGLGKLIKREAAGAVADLLKKEIETETERIREVMREKAVQILADEQAKK
jgi:hypothetical protein